MWGRSSWSSWHRLGSRRHRNDGRLDWRDLPLTEQRECEERVGPLLDEGEFAHEVGVVRDGDAVDGGYDITHLRVIQGVGGDSQI